MTDIFISYRRENSFDVERIHEKLTHKFPSASVFLDREDITPGENFPARVRDAVSKASVIVAVIGRNWISVQDPKTLKRRLELKDDWVRQELEIGLSGKGLVIPVLLDDAAVPAANLMPKSIRALHDRNGIALTHQHFNEGSEKLFRAIEEHIGRDRTRKLMAPGGNKYGSPVGLVEARMSSMLWPQVDT